KLNGFRHKRQYTRLPPGYDWDKQKQRYSPRKLQMKLFSGKFSLQNKYGHVFCHRGLYERSSGIVDNSFAAIANGIREGFFLHEVGAIIRDRLDHAFIAHEMHPKRITNMQKPWDAYSLHEILNTSLVIRGIQMETIPKKKAPCAGSNSHLSLEAEFTSTYLTTDQKIPGLLEMLWDEMRNPVGRTLQIDLRDGAFAKVFPYYSFHISKTLFPTSEASRGVQHAMVWKMFESTMLKGYNFMFESFGSLYREIKRESEKVYGRNYFELEHLHLFPPLIMVFQPDPIIALAKKTFPANSLWTKMSYEHLYDIFMKQIGSFVNIKTGRPGMSYNFILEICHSGLGLRYNKEKNTARNPLNVELIMDEKVIFESLLDRVMIDVGLELRRRHPDLLFSFCTRLPDVTTSDSQYNVSFLTGDLKRIQDGETGLSAKLRALHGGLYPRFDIVVADDPAAEIAARTWIDEEGRMPREQLLHMSYYQWLQTCATKDVRDAVMSLRKHDFLPNKFLPEHTL
ncbi:hypothetical protein QBC40DRAFT_136554, partial [Triangularia verruculosa]